MAGLRIPVETKDGVRNLDKLSKGFKKAGASAVKSESRMKGFKSATLKFLGPIGKLAGGLASVKTMLVGLAGAAGIGLVSKSFLNAATTTEGFNLRLQTLLGSAAAGNQMFRDMAEFAGKVPFEFEKIMESATTLAGIMEPKEIKEWMPVVADLAAATGISIEETTGQIQRMLSAGAASADLFRDRGVLAMLGFQAGVSYSAEETKQMLMQAWEEPTSKFAGATDAMAASWDGMISMLSDAWFAFRNMVMEAGVFDFMKAGLKIVLDQVNELRASGDLQKWANALGASVVNAFNQIIKTVGVSIDVFNQLKKVWIGLKQAWGVFVGSLAKGYELILEGNIQLAKIIPGYTSDEELARLTKARDEVAEFVDFQFDSVDKLQKQWQEVDPWGTATKQFEGYAAAVTKGAEKIKKAREEALAKGTGPAKEVKATVSKADMKTREQFDTAFDKATLTPYQLEMKQLEDLKQKYIEAGIEKVRIDQWYAEEHQQILDNESERSIAEHKRMLDEMEEEQKGFTETISETAENRFVSGMGNAVGDFINKTKSAKQAFSDFSKSFVMDITQMIIKQTILNSLQSMMGGAGGAAGGLMSGLAGMFRADGGPVTAGRSYVVGERQPETFVSNQGRRSIVGAGGPEAFKPKVSGRIEPTAQAPAPVIKIANLMDKSSFEDYLNSSEGQDAIINIMSNVGE